MGVGNSRDNMPQREASYELSRDGQRAGNDHERREENAKESFCVLFPVFGSDHDGYQDQSDGQRHQGQQKQWLFHGASFLNAVIQRYL